MTNRVLLIAPSFFLDEGSTQGLRAKATSPPLGILYIAAILQKSGYSVKVLDMYSESIQTKLELATHLRMNKPDFIGISTLTRNFKDIADIAHLCKEKFPNTPIALGGYFATFNHDKILAKYDCFDFIVRREGEETIKELVMEWEKGSRNFTKIRGLSYKANGRIRFNEDRPLITNLDALPFPAYEQVSHLSYGGFGGLRMSSNMGSVLTSRGCYYPCTYCACSILTNHTVRWRSPENVVEEIKYLHDTFGLTEYMFVDDLFTFDKKRVKKICRLIRQEGLDIDWFCEGRVNHADEHMFQEMVKGGGKAVYFGIESCVDRILKYYQKGITYRMVQEAVRKAQRAGLDVVGSFIIGAPIETVDEMRETVKKATALDIDFAQFNILRLFRGIHLWDQLVQQGLIDEENRWEETLSGFEFNSNVTIDDQSRLIREFNSAFFLRKSYILKQILRSLLRRRKQVLLNLRHPQKAISEIKRTLYL